MTAEVGARGGVALGQIADGEQQRREKFAAADLARPMPNCQDLGLGFGEILGGDFLISLFDAETAHKAQTAGPNERPAAFSSPVVFVAQRLKFGLGVAVGR